MIQIEILALILTCLGIIVSILYYASVLRNANKTQQIQLETRQAGLFMSLYETYRSPEFRRQFYSLTMQHSWSDYADYMEKYGPDTNLDVFVEHGALIGYFDGVGVLLRKGLVDVDMVNELLYPMVTLTWEKLEPIIIGARSTAPARRELYNHFEFLYDELMKREQEHLELKT